MNYKNILIGALTIPFLIPQTVSAVELTEEGLVFPNISYTKYSAGTILNETSDGTQSLVHTGDGIKIMDITNGEILDDVLDYTYPNNYVYVNDDNDLVAGLNSSNVLVYRKLGEKQYTDGGELNLYSIFGFFKNSNTLLGYGYNGISAIDLDTKKVLYTFKAKATNIAVKKDIAVALHDKISIFNNKGKFQDVIDPNSEVIDMTYTPDGDMLIVSTEDQDLQFFDATQQYKKVELDGYDNTANATGFTFDRSNKYLAFYQRELNEENNGYFRLYDFEAQQRIYSNLDNVSINKFEQPTIILSPNAKYILIQNKTYYAKTINKYVANIEIPYNELSVGQSVKPKVTAILADGSTQEVSEGVRYKVSNPNKAYVNNQGELFAANSGHITVKATYLGFSTTADINLKMNPTFNHINNYIKKKIVIYNNTGGLSKAYLDQRIYRNNQYKGAFTANVYSGYKNGKVATQYSFALKTPKKIGYSKVKFMANGKTLVTYVKTTYHNNTKLEIANVKSLSASDLKWFKTNIKEDKKATVQFIGKSKKVKKTLTKTQKNAIKDAVLLRDYL